MIKINCTSGLDRRISCKIQELSIIIEIKALVINVEVKLSFKEAREFSEKLNRLLDIIRKDKLKSKYLGE